jgi:hypothetical protein
VEAGTSVVIKNADGDTVGTTRVEQGVIGSQSDSDRNTCNFKFQATVERSERYEVQVGTNLEARGTITLNDVERGIAFILIPGCEQDPDSIFAKCL